MAGEVRSKISGWSHLSVVAFTALLLGYAEVAMMKAGVIGAAGPYSFVPPRAWFVVPLCWLLYVSLVTLPLLVVFRRTGSALGAGLAIWFFAAEHSSKGGSRVGFLAIVAVTPVILYLLYRSGRRLLERNWKPAALVLSAVFLLLAVGTLVHSGPHRVNREVPRSGARGPNVLIVFLDTVRHDALFGPDGQIHPDLPTFSRLASEGVVYDRAYSSSGWTLPSHLGAMTGLEAHELGVDFDQQNYTGDVPTIAERYRRQGYRTYAIAANPFVSSIGRERKEFDVWELSRNALDVCRTAPARILERKFRGFSRAVCVWGATEVTERAMEKIAVDGPPFFMMLNYMDAHGPYDVTRECGGELVGLLYDWTSAEHRLAYYQDYKRSIRCLDTRLRPLLDAASRDERGTVIVLTSDHGEQFGEHGMFVHSNSLYPQLLHVPLIIRWPDGRKGRVSETTSLVDIPSILEGKPPRTPGLAMATLASSSGRRALLTAIRGDWQLIVDGKGNEKLFNLREDPAAERNRVTEPESAVIAEELRQEIAKMKRDLRQPVETKFRSLGYIQ